MTIGGGFAVIFMVCFVLLTVNGTWFANNVGAVISSPC